METPIYNSTKQSFETIEKQINNFNDSVDKKVNDAIKSGRNFTQKEIDQLKKFFEEQIQSLKNMLMKEQENQTSKLTGLKDKIEAIKSLLQALSSPPSVDTIISWAKSAAQLYTIEYEQTVGRAADITLTMTYVSTEIPKLTAKLARLPDILNKIDSIPIKK